LHGIKRDREPCTRKATILLKDFAPTCKIHKGQQNRGGTCQALETCGKPCGRLCLYAPPLLELCSKHVNGTPTLPTYILRLPAELRLAIFRYHFPREIENNYVRRTCHKRGLCAILSVSRLINEEASSILYQETLFIANVSSCGVSVCGRHWVYEHHKPVNEAIPIIVRRIRNLELMVSNEVPRLWGSIGDIGLLVSDNINREEYKLYRVRNNIGKLVALLQPPNVGNDIETSLHKLVVRPNIIESEASPLIIHTQWNAPDIIPAVIFALGPLRVLRNLRSCTMMSIEVEYQELEESFPGFDTHIYLDFQRRLQSELTMTTDAERSFFTKQTHSAFLKLENDMRRIEHFDRLLRTHKIPPDGLSNDYRNTWKDTVFRGIDRVLHYARFLRDNGEGEQMPFIRKALQQRYLNYQETQHHYMSFIANAIMDLSDDPDEVTAMKSRLPSSFKNGVALKNDRYDMWPELDINFALPFHDQDGGTVEEWEDWERYYFKCGEVVKFRLKTPQTMRKMASRRHLA
jgi:hypothetical protein